MANQTSDNTPKYANLPGIAWDQPDVYETTDMPEVDQMMTSRASEVAAAIAEAGESSESLQICHIDAKQSFKKFEASQYGDFVSEGSDETPLQQFKRLESEVTSLAKHLECVQKTREGRGQDFGDIMANISALEEKMKSCRIAFQEIPNDSEKDVDIKPSLSTSVKPTASRTSLSKLSSLENRIKKLESLLDYDDDKLTSIFYYTNEKSLSEAVRSISIRVGQMDQATLDQIDHRVSALIQKLNQLSEKKSIIEDSQNKGKIAELFEIGNKVEKNMSIITETAARLNILSEIEEEAMNFSEAFVNLDKLQIEIEQTINQNSIELNALKQSFQSNFTTIKELMESIDHRVTALK